MIKVTIPGDEDFDEETSQIITNEPTVYTLEHSLASLSKWESKWEIAFLSERTMTPEQTQSYFECMVVDHDTPDFTRLPSEEVVRIKNYIESNQTATVIFDLAPQRPSRETITAELIYFWMSQLSVPFQADQWHLNKLLTLIRIANIKNAPKRKLTRSEIAEQNARLNAARREALGTEG